MSVYYTSFKTGAYFQLDALSSSNVADTNCLCDANCSYIGMTTRHLATRVHEHLHSTITKTAITEHLQVCDSHKENSNQNLCNAIKSATQNKGAKFMKICKSRKINSQLSKQLYVNGSSFSLNIF